LARKPLDVAALAAGVADVDEDGPEVEVRVTVPSGPVVTTVVAAEVCAGADVDEVPAEDVAVAVEVADDDDDDDDLALDDEELVLDCVDATVLVVEDEVTVAVEVAAD